MGETSLITDLMSDLSDEEKAILETILSEVSTTGQSEVLDSIYSEDYEEIPVDIETFITDPRFLGSSFVTEEGKLLVYKYWMDFLKKIFAPDSQVFECLSGDTKVKLLDGTSMTMEEINEKVNSSHDSLDIYAFDRISHRVVPATISNSKCMGYKPIYRITLDNGEFLDCTSNHRILMRDNTYKSIDTGLKVGDSIMPFNYYVNEKGYEIIKHPNKDGSYSQESTYKMVASHKYGKVKAYSKHIHHANYTKSDNRPRNLVALSKKQHMDLHSRVSQRKWSNDPEFKKKLAMINSERLKNLWSDEDYKNQMTELSRNNFKSTWENLGVDEMVRRSHQWQKDNPELGRDVARSNLKVYQDALARGEEWAIITHRANSRKGHESRWSDPNQRKEASNRLSSRNKDPEYQLHVKRCRVLKSVNYLIVSNIEFNEDNYTKHKSRSATRWSNLLDLFSSYEEILDLASNYNHKIVSIEYLKDDYVYDIEVPNYHNFCLENGMIVHNCGLSGAIGLGKSTIADIGLAYILHKLLCLKDPAKYYKLTKGSRIGIGLINLSLDASYGVGYAKLQSMLKNSPWFCDHGTLRGNKEKTYYPGKNIDIVVGSKMEHFIEFSDFIR